MLDRIVEELVPVLERRALRDDVQEIELADTHRQAERDDLVDVRDVLLVDAEVEFVGGPRAGERESRNARPVEIRAAGGVYRRGVRCADDGRLRYVWSPNPSADR